jgi:hypothetical protein
MNAVKTIVGATAAIAMVAGCATHDQGGPSNQTMGTILGAGAGGLIGGLAFNSAGGAIGGALVGALAGNLVGRALDQRERARLAEATTRAFGAEINEPTTYTVEPTPPTTPTTTTAAAAPPPTVVTAKPVGPVASRSDGSTCRPIELTATKNGRTSTETTTFCQAAGSTDLKPVTV